MLLSRLDRVDSLLFVEVGEPSPSSESMSADEVLGEVSV